MTPVLERMPRGGGGEEPPDIESIFSQPSAFDILIRSPEQTTVPVDRILVDTLFLSDAARIDRAWINGVPAIIEGDNVWAIAELPSYYSNILIFGQDSNGDWGHTVLEMARVENPVFDEITPSVAEEMRVGDIFSASCVGTWEGGTWDVNSSNWVVEPAGAVTYDPILKVNLVSQQGTIEVSCTGGEAGTFSSSFVTVNPGPARISEVYVGSETGIVEVTAGESFQPRCRVFDMVGTPLALSEAELPVATCVDCVVEIDPGGLHTINRSGLYNYVCPLRGSDIESGLQVRVVPDANSAYTFLELESGGTELSVGQLFRLSPSTQDAFGNAVSGVGTSAFVVQFNDNGTWTEVFRSAEGAIGTNSHVRSVLPPTTIHGTTPAAWLGSQYFFDRPGDYRVRSYAPPETTQDGLRFPWLDFHVTGNGRFPGSPYVWPAPANRNVTCVHPAGLSYRTVGEPLNAGVWIELGPDELPLSVAMRFNGTSLAQSSTNNPPAGTFNSDTFELVDLEWATSQDYQSLLTSLTPHAGWNFLSVDYAYTAGPSNEVRQATALCSFLAVESALTTEDGLPGGRYDEFGLAEAAIGVQIQPSGWDDGGETRWTSLAGVVRGALQSNFFRDAVPSILVGPTRDENNTEIETVRIIEPPTATIMGMGTSRTVRVTIPELYLRIRTELIPNLTYPIPRTFGCTASLSAEFSMSIRGSSLIGLDSELTEFTSELECGSLPLSGLISDKLRATLHAGVSGLLETLQDELVVWRLPAEPFRRPLSVAEITVPGISSLGPIGIYNGVYRTRSGDSMVDTLAAISPATIGLSASVGPNQIFDELSSTRVFAATSVSPLQPSGTSGQGAPSLAPPAYRTLSVQSPFGASVSLDLGNQFLYALSRSLLSADFNMISSDVLAQLASSPEIPIAVLTDSGAFTADDMFSSTLSFNGVPVASEFDGQRLTLQLGGLRLTVRFARPWLEYLDVVVGPFLPAISDVLTECQATASYCTLQLDAGVVATANVIASPDGTISLQGITIKDEEFYLGANAYRLVDTLGPLFSDAGFPGERGPLENFIRELASNALEQIGSNIPLEYALPEIPLSLITDPVRTRYNYVAPAIDDLTSAVVGVEVPSLTTSVSPQPFDAVSLTFRIGRR
jgi:hypothetical protein